MKSISLNKSYILLAGIVVVLAVLVVYMWRDARKLEQSLSPKAESASELNESKTAVQAVQTEDMSTASSHQRVEGKSPSPQNRFRSERKKTIKEDRESARRNTPVIGYTDDYMFEKAEDYEVEEGEEAIEGSPGL